jgi:hypothetical protein
MLGRDFSPIDPNAGPVSQHELLFITAKVEDHRLRFRLHANDYSTLRMHARRNCLGSCRHEHHGEEGFQLMHFHTHNNIASLHRRCFADFVIY